MHEQLKDNESFFKKFPTWIIAYCLDTDSFFCTNQRAFWWEYEKEFESEQTAIEYFKNHINEFRDIRNKFAQECGGLRKNGPVYLENTKENWC